MQLPGLELEDLRDRLVEEVAVVGDDQHGARELLQEGLEPREAVEVEVVGRLVEDQDRRPCEEYSGQQRAGRLAAAQRAERRVERHVGDAERVARAVELRVQRPAAERAEAILLLTVRGERLRLVQPPLELVKLAVQPPHLAERRAEQAVDRQVRPGRLLRQIADPVTRPERHAAALRSIHAGEHPQQRGLPRSVRTHQRDAARAGEREPQPVEQRGLAIRDAQVGRLEQHGEPPVPKVSRDTARTARGGGISGGAGRAHFTIGQRSPAPPQLTSEAGRTQVRRRSHYRPRRHVPAPGAARLGRRS
jgi:hypothetical protein